MEWGREGGMRGRECEEIEDGHERKEMGGREEGREGGSSIAWPQQCHWFSSRGKPVTLLRPCYGT